jgi:Ser/Thr protein kinase RdoA (MazF antagonist)
MAPTNPDPARLASLADRFGIRGNATSVEPLGSGNVNDTFRVETSGGETYVLQRLNTAVFPQPELVMANLEQLTRHCRSKGDQACCQLPRPIPLRSGGGSLLRESDGSYWRLLSFIGGGRSVDVLENSAQAEQIGRGLGRFHALVHDLPGDQLHDTLEGFHVTPRYLEHYREVLDQVRAPSSTGQAGSACPESAACEAFVEERLDLVPVLEHACAAGRLRRRPIHGDPKVNNVLLCERSGRALALVDLDTVKPGLVHYDIGDCLRSACNRAGEETTDLEGVHFDLDLAEALLRGYLAEAGSCLSEADLNHLYDSIRLLPFELGLRFFTDHLAGNVYFKARHPRHNLERARVQFRLTESIEAQENELRVLIRALSPSATR